MNEHLFWGKVEITNTCWVWQAAQDQRGYGRFNVNGRNEKAYRVAYQLLVGEIPEGTEIDHVCRNKSCVNPDHLEAVSHRENILRGTSPSAIAAAKTHCINGHELTPENNYPAKSKSGNPRRRCRACHLASGIKTRQKKKSLA